MKKLWFGAMIVFITTFLSNSQSIDNQKLLKKIDELNSFGDDFAFEMDVRSFKGDSLVLGNSLAGYVKINDNHEIKSLLYFTAPNDVKDRKMLVEGKYIWALFPKTKNLLRLTPLQILLGEVAYGDVLRIIYSDIYNVRSLEEVKENNQDFYILNLLLKEEKRGESYFAVKLKVDKATLRIVYSEMLSNTDKVIKKVYYENPTVVNQKNINTVIRIHDGVNTSNHSVLKYTRMAKKAVPAGCFNKDYLSKFRKYEF